MVYSSIEDMAKQLKNLKARKVKLDTDIIALEKNLNDKLKSLGIKRETIIVREPTTYPQYYPIYQPIIFPFDTAPTNPFQPIWTDHTGSITLPNSATTYTTDYLLR